MKNILIISALLISLHSYSQSDTVAKKHRHELGADVTGLLKQFFNFNSDPYNYNTYTPTYYVSYRYYLKNANIRFGIGGSYYKNSTPTYTINGQEKTLFNMQNNLSLRIGYEFKSELSKRWQVFYGADFRPTFSTMNNQAQYANGGYINGRSEEIDTYGIAPLLGFRFRLSNRVSITTEMSFSLNYTHAGYYNTFISVDNSLYPDMLNSKTINNSTISASFAQPVFLILTANL